MSHHKLITRSGFALPMVLAFFPFIILITILAAELSLTSVQASRSDNYGLHAQFAADAGIDYALNQLNSDSDWPGTGAIAVHSGGNLASNFTISVSDIDDRHKLVEVTGTTERDGSSVSTRSLEATVRGVGGGSFSVVTGVGGLFMSNSAKILGGNVFVNGEIDMSNTAQIGLASNSDATEVKVAHQICGGASDYPRVCNHLENGQPITMNNSAHIYARVEANNQVDGSAMTDTGLVGGQLVSDPDNPPVVPEMLPDYDRPTHKANSVVEKTGAEMSCNSNGTMNWPANVKIVGDVTIEKKCIVYTAGDIWITGNLFMKQSGTLRPENVVGANTTNIMVDGIVEMTQAAKFDWNSSDGSYRVITHRSSASCSPDCADVTGNDLQNSRNDQTIRIKNSASGEKTIFYARWTQVSVDNSGGVGALIGQTIELKNSAAITFGAEAASGEPSRWVIDTYQRVF